MRPRIKIIKGIIKNFKDKGCSIRPLEYSKLYLSREGIPRFEFYNFAK